MESSVISYQFSSHSTWLILGTHGSATDVFMTQRRYLDNCTIALWPWPSHGPLMLAQWCCFGLAFWMTGNIASLEILNYCTLGNYYKIFYWSFVELKHVAVYWQILKISWFFRYLGCTALKNVALGFASTQNKVVLIRQRNKNLMPLTEIFMFLINIYIILWSHNSAIIFSWITFSKYDWEVIQTDEKVLIVEIPSSQITYRLVWMVFDFKTWWGGGEGEVQNHASWEKSELQNLQPC